MPTFKNAFEIQDYHKEESRKARQENYLWANLVGSQHSFFANLAGLGLTALVIFTSINGGDLTQFQKYLISFSLVFIFLQVLSLIFMSHHERQNAFGNISRCRNYLESWARGLLYLFLGLSWLTITVLIIVSIWE